MHDHGGLAVFIGGEFLRGRDRNRRVAMNDFLNNAAHGFQPQRQGHNIKQQIVRAAREAFGLNGGAYGDHFVGVDMGEWFLAEEGFYLRAHIRRARHTAYQHHAGNIFGREPDVFERLRA